MITVILGPTACGKSELALEIARKCHILSCDSLLVYKDLNLGTAKPSKEEMQAVPHHGIDLVEAGDDFSVGDYVAYARPIIDKLVTDKIPLIIVGGTGFYLKSLLFGMWDAPPADEKIRRQITDGVASHPKEEQARMLHEALEKKDPQVAKKIPAGDIYRVIRALEIIEISGKKVSTLDNKNQLLNPLPYPFKILGIKREKPDLEQRITERTNQMFQNGFIHEVEQLVKKYPFPHPRALNCVGYREVIAFLKGSFSLSECKERIVISTRQLARKQRTFFNGMLKETKHRIEWYRLPNQADEVIRLFI